VARGAPIAHVQVAIGRKGALEGALKQRGIGLIRGRPQRAQGTLKHYFPYSEVMVLIGLLPGVVGRTWGRYPLEVSLGSYFLLIAAGCSSHSHADISCQPVVWLFLDKLEGRGRKTRPSNINRPFRSCSC